MHTLQEPFPRIIYSENSTDLFEPTATLVTPKLSRHNVRQSHSPLSPDLAWSYNLYVGGVTSTLCAESISVNQVSVIAKISAQQDWT